MKMPHEILLEPTPQDRDMGVCNSPRKCMLNLTLRRHFPTATFISINPNGASVTVAGEYHRFHIPLKGVSVIAKFDKLGKNMSDAELKKSKFTIVFMDTRPATYKGTDAEKKFHRERSARYRARPGYIRPDGKQTVRAQISRTVKHKKSNAKDLL